MIPTVSPELISKLILSKAFLDAFSLYLNETLSNLIDPSLIS